MVLAAGMLIEVLIVQDPWDPVTVLRGELLEEAHEALALAEDEGAMLVEQR